MDNFVRERVQEDVGARRPRYSRGPVFRHMILRSTLIILCGTEWVSNLKQNQQSNCDTSFWALHGYASPLEEKPIVGGEQNQVVLN